MSARVLTTLVVVLAASPIGGCFAKSDAAGGADIGYMPDEVPSGERCDTGDGSGTSAEACETTGGTVPEGAVGSPCDGSVECNAGLVCAAPFDRGERGVYACVGACIGLMDEARWCADASACCDPDALCTTRGYCIAPQTGTTGTTGTIDDAESGSGGATTGSTTG